MEGGFPAFPLLRLIHVVVPSGFGIEVNSKTLRCYPLTSSPTAWRVDLKLSTKA